MIDLKTKTYSAEANYNTINWDGSDLLFNGVVVGNGDEINVTLESTDQVMSSVSGYLEYKGQSSTDSIKITLNLSNGEIINLFNDSTNTLTVVIDSDSTPPYKILLGSYDLVRVIFINDIFLLISNTDALESLWEFNEVTCTITNTAALDSNGQAWAWGQASFGQLGNDNSVGETFTPVQVCGGHTFCKITSSQYTIYALKSNGEVWSWGRSTNGVLGNNTSFPDVSTPVQVCGGHTFCKINSTDSHVLAIDHLGAMWAWGRNIYGEFGDNTTSNKSTPVQVCGSHTFCHVAAGQYFSVAIDHLGAMWAWGNNSYGQLGDNTTTSKRTPVQVCGGHTFCHVAAGDEHTVAIDHLGQAWCWGRGSVGRLGDNTTSNKSTPVQVCGGHTFCHVAVGNDHSLAIDNNGQAWSWGESGNHQLGYGSNTDKCTPMQVCGGHTFCKIEGGSSHSVGIDEKNKIWAWGRNFDSQIGNNETDNFVCFPESVVINNLS
jgi:alpha-tubulin suppressor-like RCC1 family protein